MSDILLTHGYFLFEDEKEIQVMKPYPTLGLLYLSSYLQRAGFAVEVFDTTFARREELYSALGGRRGVVGIYTNLITRRSVLDIIREAKRCGWTVVLGGPESANYPVQYLDAGADVVVVGEGETTLTELLARLPVVGPRRLQDVRGIHFKDESGAATYTSERGKIRDLDLLPLPDREAIDHHKYLEVWRQRHGASSINLITAR